MHLTSLNRPLRRCASVAAYSLFYLAAFSALEHRPVAAHLLTTAADFALPFCPVFVVPYLLWFPFVGLVLWYFLLRGGERDYHALTSTLSAGCTVFLAISFFFPNAQNLRPAVEPTSPLRALVALVYALDTPTNIFPSIHVFHSVACCVAVLQCRELRRRPFLCVGAVVLTALIILSTLLLKQHTLLDVGGALALNLHCFLLYQLPLPEKKRLDVRQREG